MGWQNCDYTWLTVDSAGAQHNRNIAEVLMYLQLLFYPSGCKEKIL